jgi:hypothetical protein
LQELLELSSKSEVDAIRLLEIASAEIEKWSECLVDQRTKLDTAMKHLKGIAERQVDELEARLIPTLRAEGFTVMGDGGLIIVDGVVHIGLNLKQRTVSINDHQANNLAISSLIASIVEEVNKIKKLTTTPDRFLSLLFSAYKDELSTKKSGMGSQVHISSLHWRVAMLRQETSFHRNPLAKSFKEYPRELFRSDLHALLSSAQFSIEGFTFRYSPGSDTTGSVFTFVPALGRVAHIGRIWFERG